MYEEIERKKKLVLSYLQEHPNAYIGEISDATSIPKSTVQRYLESFKDRIILKTNLTVKEQLKLNKLRGQRKGGMISFENNDTIKDSKGRFTGSVKSISEDKELQKQKDILVIGTFYLYRKQISLQELADEISSLGTYGTYTKDYVYDCLTDQRLSGLLGEDAAREIELRLTDAYKSSFPEAPKKVK